MKLTAFISFAFFFSIFLQNNLCAQKNIAQKDSGWFYSFDSTRIYYETAGKGYPVVLVHGFIANSESWKKTALFNDLQNADFKVITVDLRGNGKSGKPHTDTAYANDAEAKDVMRLMDYLNILQYDAIGYSRGAIIVSRLLVLDKRLKKGVLGGMGADFTNPNWPRRQMFYRALSGENVKELEEMVNYVKSAGLDQKALALLQKEQPSTSEEELSKIENKVLVICGYNDADNGSASQLALMIPNSFFIKVPGDHNTTVQSKQFATNVINFLQHDAAGPTP